MAVSPPHHDQELNNCSLELLAFRKRIKQVIHEKDNDASYPLLPQRIVADVRRGLDKDAIIALDNGMYKIWFARHYHTYMPNTVNGLCFLVAVDTIKHKPLHLAIPRPLLLKHYQVRRY
jgi:hypothetical protein